MNIEVIKKDNTIYLCLLTDITINIIWVNEFSLYKNKENINAFIIKSIFYW